VLNGFFVPRSNSITMSVLFDSIDWWRVSLHFYERAIVIPHPPCSYSRIWGQAISRNQTHIDSHSLATHARFAYYIRATYVSIFVHVRACMCIRPRAFSSAYRHSNRLYGKLHETCISPAIVVSIVSKSRQIFKLMIANYGIYGQLRR